MTKIRLIVCTLALLLTSILPSSAQQTTTGTLTCKTSASLGLIVGSRQRLACIYRPSSGGPSESYSGQINRLGLDVGITAGGILAWAVLGPANGFPPRALAGKYVGASGDISLGVGVGANALVGGNKRSVVLQPVSIEGNIGVNLALGVAALTLR